MNVIRSVCVSCDRERMRFVCIAPFDFREGRKVLCTPLRNAQGSASRNQRAAMQIHVGEKEQGMMTIHGMAIRAQWEVRFAVPHHPSI